MLSLIFDIGTTNIAAALISGGGEVLLRQNAENPQARFGSDLISRLCAEKEFGFEALGCCLKERINEMISGFLPLGNYEEIKRISVAGNTVMSSYFAGVSPSPLAAAPFKPTDLFGRKYAGGELSLICEGAEVYIAPCFNGFVGGDISAGIVGAGLDMKIGAAENSFLYIDIGTNGECLLSHKGKVLVCSAAAGPVLEGCLSCGCTARRGAVISAGRGDNGEIFYLTSGGEPEGLAGSGVISLIAALLGREIDESGHLENGSFALFGDKTLSQADVTAFQLAKAAVAAAVRALLFAAGIGDGDIDEVYIAGALGEAAATDDLVRVGLLSEAFGDKTVKFGNMALKGAQELLKPEGRERALSLTQRAKVLPLASNRVFKDSFAEETYFKI